MCCGCLAAMPSHVCVLRQRRLAMQDVSLKNTLIIILDDWQFQIKICDLGQAVIFRTDSQSGEELPVEFSGFVGKSVRPPELHLQEVLPGHEGRCVVPGLEHLLPAGRAAALPQRRSRTSGAPAGVPVAERALRRSL